LWPAGGEETVKRAMSTDPLARALADQAMANARHLLGERTCRYEIPDGKRLLAESRRALGTITHCAWAWRMTRDKLFLDRTVRELDAACALKDWNTKHFLDTAEMALAVATGYDWLFDQLTPDQRRRYEDAIIAKALKPAHGVYQKGGWWAAVSNNWSQVCGSGIALAAAAVAERDREMCGDLFTRGLRLIDGCTRFYEPDGGYPEGPGYWHYGSNFHIFLLAACGPLGIEAKVPEVWRKSGNFMAQVVGPTRLPFNFADGGAGRDEPSPAQSWIASHFADAGQARHLRAMLRRALDDGTSERSRRAGRHFPLHLLWLPAEPAGKLPPQPLAARFGGEQPMAMFRTSWQADAAYLAVKGGTALASHGQMDVGSFVYDALGVRWFHDMGADDYNMPGYFGKQRFDYFRLTNRSHNTLVVNDQLQSATRKPAELLHFETKPASARAVFDLAPAYQKQAAAVKRTAAFDSKTGTVTMEDHVTAPAGPVRWAAVTRAKVRIDGPRVTLEESGKQLVLTRGDNHGGDWQVSDATPPTSRENPNRDFRIVHFSAPAAAELRLRVAWEPLPNGDLR
jgi:hypothetical protein